VVQLVLDTALGFLILFYILRNIIAVFNFVDNAGRFLHLEATIERI